MPGVNFTPGSAREIARTVEKVRMLFPPLPTGGAGPTVPLWLAKTTASHAIGTAQNVTLMTGPKGAETPRSDTVSAYSRYQSYDTNDLVIVGLIGEGWEILCPFESTSGTADCGCTDCYDRDLAVMETDLDFGVYRQYIFTGESDFPFSLSGVDYDEPGAASSDFFDIDCGEDTVSVYWKLTYTGNGIGEVTLSLLRESDDSVVATWTNQRGCWRPWCKVRLTLTTYDDECETDLPECICMAPFMTGGCTCGGHTFAMKVTIAGLTDRPVACTGGNIKMSAFNGTWILNYSNLAGGVCRWLFEMTVPDLCNGSPGTLRVLASAGTSSTSRSVSAFAMCPDLLCQGLTSWSKSVSLVTCDLVSRPTDSFATPQVGSLNSTGTASLEVIQVT